MTEVHVSTQLVGTTKLWRYMSLDKLVDLLSTGELFFTPLAFLVATDPFEGYLPEVAMEADSEIWRPVISDFELAIAQLEDHSRKELEEKLRSMKAAPKRYFQSIHQCTAVSCWHKNDGESEAMWRLYADNGKAVAIETNVEALNESIRARQSEHRVHIYPVRYLDFFDKTLKPTDCVVEGHRAPLLKRRSYQHENEVRAFIGRVPNTPQESADIEFWRPTPVRLPLDTRVLVRCVHISPYSGEPFGSSVTKVCELFGLPGSIVEPSKLLLGQEELLKPFDF